MITKTERTELRSIVRQQFKVLRSELDQRELELFAEVEDEIVARFADTDHTWEGVLHQIHEAVLEANRAVNDALYEAGYQAKGRSERMWVVAERIQKPQGNRHELRIQAHTRIKAQTKAARLRLDREEADLLRNLAMGVIESEEALAFLAAIPSVGQLVPSARLAELEAALDADGVD